MIRTLALALTLTTLTAAPPCFAQDAAPETDLVDQASPDQGLWGVGARIGAQDDGSFRVDGLQVGSPAALSQELQVNDRIAAVDKGDGVFVDVAGLKLDQVIKLMRGEKGTTLRLRVSSPGAPADQREISLTRSQELNLTDEIYDRKEAFGRMAEMLETIGDARGRRPGGEDSFDSTIKDIVAKNFPRAASTCDTRPHFLGCLYKTLAAIEYAESLRLGLSGEEGQEAGSYMQELLQDPGLLHDADTIGAWSQQPAPLAEGLDLQQELQRQAKSHYRTAHWFFVRRAAALLYDKAASEETLTPSQVKSRMRKAAKAKRGRI